MLNALTVLIKTGLGSLASYLAAHVLLCLLPAFFIAGALSALVPKAAITRFLGRSTPKWISYPAAALGGFVLAVCSYTIMPLFAGIYAKGAGLGPAITFLFVGPAINILALSLTGAAIGMDVAAARVILSVVFGIVIGIAMAWLYRRDDTAHDTATGTAFSRSERVSVSTPVLLVLLLSVLIAGTLQAKPLTQTLTSFTIGRVPAAMAQQSAASGSESHPGWATRFQTWLDRAVPADATLGAEGLTVQGVTLIGLLIVVGATSWRGLGAVDEGYSRWTGIALAVITFTIIIASIGVAPTENGLLITIRGKSIAVVILLATVWWVTIRYFERYEIQSWLWEVWRFAKQIVPLLLVGVFVAGAARGLVPAEWIQRLAGRNTVWANLAGVLFGVVMYFPTLVEVPIAQTFLALGMQRGPLLAYLLADPELSIQSILITSSVIGKRKTAVYVVLVTVFSTLAGLLFGVVTS
jgi:uncharacterized membrane protein YraQ (UPF0718 family)